MREIFDKRLYNVSYVWVKEKDLLSDLEIGLARLNYSCANFSLLNNELMNTIYSLDSNLQRILYGYKVKLLDSQEEDLIKIDHVLNQFDVSTQIVSSCVKIESYYSSLNSFQVNDYDMQYVLKNSLNELLLRYYDSASLLIEYANMNLINVINTGLIFLSVLVVLSIVLYSLIVKNIIKFNKERKNFFNMLLTVDIENFKVLLSKLQKIYNILSKNHHDELLLCHCQLSRKNNNNIRKTNTRKQNSRRAKFTKLNSKNNFILMLAFISLLVMISIYSITLIVIKNFNDYEITKNQQASYFQNSFHNYAIGIASINEYISENKTTIILDQDINIVLENIMSKLNNTQELIQLFTTNKGLLDPNFSEFLTGNLCELGTPLQKQSCKWLPNSSAQMGLLGANNFISNNLQQLALVYQESNQTEDVIRALLSGELFFQTKGVYDIYVRETCMLINQRMYDGLKLDLKSIGEIIGILGYLSGIVIVIVGVLMRNIIYNSIKYQDNNLKSILRLLPIDVILSNNSLKLYLIRTSKSIMKSIQMQI